MAVERLKGCDNIVALSAELGVHRRLLYKWRDQLEPIDDGQAPPENSKERELRLQVGQLKRLVAGGGEPGWFLPVAAGAGARRGKHGSPVGDSEHLRRTQAALWIPAG